MSVCEGCGAAMKETGAPIWEEYCPNQQCTYQRDQFFAQVRANMAETEKRKRLERAAPELLSELTEARTTISILRTQVTVEIGRCANPSESRWEGVPEKLKERIDAIDAAIAKATGETP